MEHGAKSLSSHQTAPAWSQLVGYLLTLPHTCDQTHSRCACLLPGSWAVALSTENLVLEMCTSAPASATKALLHLPPDTSPRCLAYPVTMRRYSQTQGQSVWTRDFANSPHGMSLLPPQSPLQGYDTHPHDSHHLHRVAEGSSLPTMPASWHRICGGVILCSGPARMGRMELTGRWCPGRKVCW